MIFFPSGSCLCIPSRGSSCNRRHVCQLSLKLNRITGQRILSVSVGKCQKFVCWCEVMGLCMCVCAPYSSCRSILSSTACRAAASDALVSSSFWCTNKSTLKSVTGGAGAVTPPPVVPLSTDTPPMEERGGLTGGGVGLGVAGVWGVCGVVGVCGVWGL